MLAFFISHPEAISIVLLFCSELMPLVTKGDSNGIIHLVVNTVKKLLGKSNGAA